MRKYLPLLTVLNTTHNPWLKVSCYSLSSINFFNEFVLALQVTLVSITLEFQVDHM